MPDLTEEIKDFPFYASDFDGEIWDVELNIDGETIPLQEIIVPPYPEAN